jgi:hypothetical protein
VKQYLKTAIFIFILLVIVFFPVELNFFPWQKQISEALFSGLIFSLAKLIHYPLYHCDFSSDSASMYFLFNVLLGLALIVSIFFHFNPGINTQREKIFGFIRSIAAIYLSVILLKYGFNKIFKWQFYMPEPNILYTPLGHLSKDILYWSSMGTSWWYSFFSGMIEIIPAVLILFRKTRVAGLIIALFVMINVFAINIGFDISVKLFSLFLIFIILLLLKPQLVSLYDFLILQKKTSLQAEMRFIFLKKERLHKTVKPLLIALCFIETSYPYITTMNFNDDTSQRSFLHGAYQPIGVSYIPLADGTGISFTRFYIHRQGYLIFELNNGTMKDYKMSIDSRNHTLRCAGYNHEEFDLQYEYHTYDSTLNLSITTFNNTQYVRAKAIDYNKLPALQDRFHWIVDQYGNVRTP